MGILCLGTEPPRTPPYAELQIIVTSLATDDSGSNKMQNDPNDMLVLGTDASLGNTAGFAVVPAKIQKMAYHLHFLMDFAPATSRTLPRAAKKRLGAELGFCGAVRGRYRAWRV